MIQDPIAIAILLGSFALLILIRTPIAFALGFFKTFVRLRLDFAQIGFCHHCSFRVYGRINACLKKLLGWFFRQAFY